MKSPVISSHCFACVGARPNFQTLFIVLSLTSAALSIAYGAAAPSAPDEVFELSPFEVASSKDTGYAAQNTLSGTRISTAVRDIGGTMSVITPEFWEDLAITGTNDLILFTPGAEKEELQSAEGSGQALNFGDNTRVRGIKIENIVRNGFRSNIPSDTYNASRFEFQRGPNAILFGTSAAGGGDAGLVNRTTQDASFSNQARYQLRIDEFGSIRHSLMSEREIIPKKLAIKAALLNDRTKYWIEPTFQNQRRAYGAILYRPATNLTLRLRYENIDWLRAVNDAGMHFDGVTPVLNAASAAGVSPAQISIRSASNLQQTNVAGLPDYYMNNGYRAQNTTALVYRESGDTPALENWRYKVIGANSSVSGTQNVSLPQGIVPLDFNIFGNVSTQDFQGYNVNAVAQYKLSRKIDVEYAYNYERMIYDFIGGPGNRLQIDGARTLQDGVTPNPNAGRYFVVHVPAGLWQDRYVSNHRAIVTLNHDFREGGPKWLGKHTLVAMGESANQTYYFDQMRLLNTTPLPGYPAALWDSSQANAIRFVNYVDPKNKTITGILNARDFEAVANRIPGVNAKFLPIVGTGKAFDQTTDSLLFVWQGRFWNDRIVATAGMRTDKFRPFNGPPGTQDPNAPIGVAIPSRKLVMEKDVLQSSLSPDTKNYSVVFHALRNLGVIDYLSPYYNYSTSFGFGLFNYVPDGSRTSHTSGETSDYGLKFGLLGDRVAGVFSFFKAENKNNDSIQSGINFGDLSDLFEYLDPVKYSQYINVAPIRETQDVTSTGWEFQLTANITKNWRASMSVDHFKTELDNIAPTTGRLIEQFRSQWLARPTDLVPGSNRTVQSVFDTVNFSYLRTKAQEGAVTMNERAYKATFLTNYSFTRGWLKNVGVGMDMVWQDRAVTGFGLQYVGAQWIPNPSHPFYSGELFRVGAHCSYRRSLFNDRVRWIVQVNVQNLGGVAPFVVRHAAVSTAPDTPVATYYHRGYPQTFILTNTFQF